MNAMYVFAILTVVLVGISAKGTEAGHQPLQAAKAEVPMEMKQFVVNPENVGQGGQTAILKSRDESKLRPHSEIDVDRQPLRAAKNKVTKGNTKNLKQPKLADRDQQMTRDLLRAKDGQKPQLKLGNSKIDSSEMRKVRSLKNMRGQIRARNDMARHLNQKNGQPVPCYDKNGQQIPCNLPLRNRMIVAKNRT